MDEGQVGGHAWFSGSIDAGVVRDGGASAIPAAEIRKFLISQRGVADPRNFHLRGGVIQEDLDLSGVDWPAGLFFERTTFVGRVLLVDAKLRSVRFRSCRLGGVDAMGAEFRGQLSFLRDAHRADVTTSSGCLRLNHAQIDGDLEFGGLHLTKIDGPVLLSNDTSVSGTVYLGDEFLAIGACEGGLVQFIGARIGRLECAAARVCNKVGSSIQADGAQIRQDVVFGAGFLSVSAGEHGGLRLPGASIGGDLDCRGASFVNEHQIDIGPAFEAGRVRVSNHVFMAQGFRARSKSHHGTVHMPGADIGGLVDFSQSWIINDNKAAVVLDDSRISGSLRLGDGFRAEGGIDRSAISLERLQVGGSLDALGGKVKSGAVYAVNLTGSKFGGQLKLDKHLACRGGIAEPAGSDPEETTEFPAWVKVPDRRTAARPVVDRVEFRERREVWPDPDEKERWRNWLWESTFWRSDGIVKLSYCTYDGVPSGIALSDLLRWFTADELGYDPSVFQQLAQNFDREGSQADARITRIAQQREFVRSGQASYSQKLWRRVLGLLVGYGYRPVRALYWLAALMVIAVIFCALVPNGSWLMAVDQSRSTTTDAASVAKRCSASESISYAISLTLPIITGGGNKACQVRPGGGILTFLAFGELMVQLLGWLLASVFVAGIVGVIRSEERR